MAKYRVDVSEPAENDLRDIVRYIASQLSVPISATRMMELFEEAMLSLSDMPQRCPLVSDDRLSQMGYRKLIVKNYVVFFSIDEKNKVVDVERILYGGRDFSESTRGRSRSRNGPCSRHCGGRQRYPPCTGL
jgi:toxin ParE1/3/4